MLISELDINHNTASIQRHKFLNKVSKKDQLQSALKVYLLQAVIESFVDGILILSTQGELLHANECARRIWRKLRSGENFMNAIPEEIWSVCQSLIENRKLFPDQKTFIESEMETDKSVKLRLRVRWLQLCASNDSVLLVTLEDCNQSSQNTAIADAKKYGLTDREAEVWLLRKANLSYKQIADQLFITINTVKKHLKNIYAKQQDMLCLQ
jgi:DNA-binding CsgD family transcriptional regulator